MLPPKSLYLKKIYGIMKHRIRTDKDPQRLPQGGEPLLLCKYTALEEDRQGLYRFRGEENKGEQYVSFTGNTFGSGTGSDRIFSGQQFRAPDARQQSDGD